MKNERSLRSRVGVPVRGSTGWVPVQDERVREAGRTITFYSKSGPMRFLLVRMVWATLLCPAIGIQGAGAQPDSLDERLTVASEAYAQGQYGRAVEVYHDILGSGYESGALFYNLGNAYGRLDQWGQAIRYYEKARRLRPADPRVLHNLNQVRRRAGLKSERGPEMFRYGVGAVIQEWSPTLIFVVGWLLLIGGLAVALVWLWSESGIQFQRPIVWGTIGAGLLAIAVAIGISYLQAMNQYAVVVADEVPVRAAPDQGAITDTTLREGTVLEVTSRQTEWHEVRLSEGASGWVPVRAVGDI